MKSVQVDLSVTGADEVKASIDAVDARAELLKKEFPAWTAKLDTAAASAKLQVFRADFKTVADTVNKAMVPQVLSGRAAAALDDIRVKADELKATFPEFTVRINDKVAKAELDLFAAEAKVKLDALDKEIAGAGSAGIGRKLLGLIPGVSGGSSGIIGGADGTGTAASAASSGGGGVLTNPYALAGGAAAALVAIPLLAQAAAGAITFGLGGALAGMAILGASKSKEVIKSFDTLKTSATADLTTIGASFVPAVDNILQTATSVLGKLTPVFAGAEKVISGPFQTFSDSLLKTFNTPAVKTSIEAVASSFGKLLTALSPSLAKDASDIASGITKVADAIGKNPDAFRDFVSFLSATVGGVLTAIASLTTFANYIEAHFIPVFDGVRHAVAAAWGEIASNTTAVWNAVWTETTGRVIQGAHQVEATYNAMKAAISTALAAVSSGAQTAWNTLWNNTVTRVQNGIADTVRFFTGLPGKITSTLGNAAAVLYNWGSGVIGGLLSGIKSVWQSVVNFFVGLPKAILSALGIASPPGWAIQAGKDIMAGLGIGITGHLKSVVGAASAVAAGVSAALASGGGGSNAANIALAKKMAAAKGWTGAQWTDLLNVIMRESGGSSTVVNSSSGAAGIAQNIAGFGPGYQSGNAAQQIAWMLAYVQARYSTPAAALAHEQQYGWYGSGLDATFSRPTLIGVGESGPEHVTVTPRGNAGGGGQDQLGARLDRLIDEVRQLRGVAAAIPAKTGQHVGAAIGGAAHAASFRARYP